MTLRYLTREADRAVTKELRRIDLALLRGRQPRTLAEWTALHGPAPVERIGEPGPITARPCERGGQPSGFHEEQLEIHGNG